MARMAKVQGSERVYLLPTLTSEGSADYRRGGMEYAIASLPPVRRVVRDKGREGYRKAQGILASIRAIASIFGADPNKWVQIELMSGRTDYTLVLTDTKGGTKGAMSIEYGRDPYLIEDEDGNMVEVGGMAGKHILHRAFGVPPGVLKGTGGGDVG